MKKALWIALVATITLVMAIGSVSFAADEKAKKKLRDDNGNGDLHSGQVVKLAELGEDSGQGEKLTKGDTVRVADLPNGVKIYSKGEKGEWIRLGENFGGANTISEIVVKVCSKPYITAVLNVNGITEKQARKLDPGYGIYIPHKYLKPEYRYSLERLVKAYAVIDQLKERLRDNGLSDEVEIDLATLGELECDQGKLNAALAEAKRLNGELSLRDEKITELQQENEQLKTEIEQLKTTITERDDQVSGLKDELAAEKQKRKDAIGEIRVAMESFLKRLDELEAQ